MRNSLSTDERKVMGKLDLYGSLQVYELNVPPGVVDQLIEIGLVAKQRRHVSLTPRGKAVWDPELKLTETRTDR